LAVIIKCCARGAGRRESGSFLSFWRGASSCRYLAPDPAIVAQRAGPATTDLAVPATADRSRARSKYDSKGMGTQCDGAARCGDQVVRSAVKRPRSRFQVREKGGTDCARTVSATDMRRVVCRCGRIAALLMKALGVLPFCSSRNDHSACYRPVRKFQDCAMRSTGGWS
jgi:hypothetical protein